MTPERIDQAKSLMDVAAYFTALGALMSILPNIAAGLSVVWLCIQISQSKCMGYLWRAIGRLWRWLRSSPAA